MSGTSMLKIAFKIYIFCLTKPNYQTMRKKWLLIISSVVLVLVAGGIVLYYQMFPKPAIDDTVRASLKVMPLPAKVRMSGSAVPADMGLSVVFTDYSSPVLDRAVTRFRERLERITESKIQENRAIRLEIQCGGEPISPDPLKNNERYSLRFKSDHIILEAPGVEGVLHGLETLSQLPVREEEHYIWPGYKIEDAPRYAWRGLMIDVCRHWIPKAVILRNLDGMAALKLNVLHLHLTEYQGFRIESKLYPKLQGMGSGGNYYSQDDMREIIQYASDRGITVVPEFDIPGHSTSWFTGYPELASAPGPYVCDTVFGVLHPVMDPTKDSVYLFLDRFLGEMAGLFPGKYLHIGGDEVEPTQWENNPDIQSFMKENNITDAHGLQAYFNHRINEIAKKHGKVMVGWDEILHPDLTSDVIVQSWRSQKSLFEAVQKGGRAILSAGWYLDHKLPAGKHYQVDPEILPGAVDIEPDSVNWQTWDLELQMKASEGKLSAKLALFGTPENVRGFMQIMGATIGFKTVGFDGRKLDFTMDTDYGKAEFSGTLESDSLTGKMSVSIMGFEVKGTKVGGPEMAGTRPVEFEKIRPLNEEEKTRIIGGEACMWSELVNARTIDSRIWPRMAAIAEKLWSPAALTTSADDMYRRLPFISAELTARGLTHDSDYPVFLAEIGGPEYARPLKILADQLEEVKYYERLGMYENLTVYTPLNRVVDAVRPESLPARHFNQITREWVSEPENNQHFQEIKGLLEKWKGNHARLEPAFAMHPRIAEVAHLSESLSFLAEAGLEAVDLRMNKEKPTSEQTEEWNRIIDKASQHSGGCQLAVVDGFRSLFQFE